MSQRRFENRDPSRDPSNVHEAGKSTEKEIDFRVNLGDYFEHSVGSTVERLESFTKYVPRQKLTEFIAKYELFKKIINVEGSIIECGVYYGGGLMAFAQLSAIFEPVNHKRKIVGFDTFSGFTSLSEADEKAISNHSRLGGFAADSYEDLKTCIELFDSNRFLGHLPKISVVKGDIKETLPKYLNEHPHTLVSLLHLDMNVYEPTKVALEHLVPRMPKGAILFFDELNDGSWPGETAAVMETVGISNLRIQRLPFDASVAFAVIE